MTLQPNTSLRIAAVALVCLLLTTGCAGLNRRPPPTLEHIVQMSRDGRTAEDIIRELQDTRAVYPLTGTQIVGLHRDGVPDAVLDYLQNAYVESIRLEARMHHESSFWWRNCLYCYNRPIVIVPR